MLGRSVALTVEAVGRMLTSEGRTKVSRTLLATRADAIDRQTLQLRSLRGSGSHATAFTTTPGG